MCDISDPTDYKNVLGTIRNIIDCNDTDDTDDTECKKINSYIKNCDPSSIMFEKGKYLSMSINNNTISYTYNSITKSYIHNSLTRVHSTNMNLHVKNIYVNTCTSEIVKNLNRHNHNITKITENLYVTDYVPSLLLLDKEIKEVVTVINDIGQYILLTSNLINKIYNVLVILKNNKYYYNANDLISSVGFKCENGKINIKLIKIDQIINFEHIDMNRHIIDPLIKLTQNYFFLSPNDFPINPSTPNLQTNFKLNIEKFRKQIPPPKIPLPTKPSPKLSPSINLNPKIPLPTKPSPKLSLSTKPSQKVFSSKPSPIILLPTKSPLQQKPFK